MYPFKQTFPTPAEHTPWKNTCEYIIIHHTWTWEWTIKWVLDWLYKRDDYASCHFVIDTNGDAYKIWNPTDILWHAWESSWWKRKDMNKYSLWIEVIWPLSDGWFTSYQKVAVKKLIQHLMSAFKIPKENVLRHKDIAPKRKWDISDTFFSPWYTGYEQFRDKLVPKLID